MRTIVRAAIAIGTVMSLATVGGGCLTRPAVHDEPTTYRSFTTQVTQQGVDKVDILFMIDNSASMGDKQAYLSLAVPDLLKRLLDPNCLDDKSDARKGVSSEGSCPDGEHAEFPAVHDMHVGVITSALGPRGGDACKPDEVDKITGQPTHNDDRGELINRGGATESPVPDMGASNFLSWFPDVPANQGVGAGNDAKAIGDVTKLQSDFQDLIAGVHQLGCGIESQLESWYRFLIQPDPYDTITTATDDKGRPAAPAAWSGVDATILQQRHDFLRPDSLVAIIDLTDENDSEIDVRALNGQGFFWLRNDYAPYRATSACAANPADPRCVSCAEDPSDSNCLEDPGTGKGQYPSKQQDWGYNLNVRHVHMKEKYGVDVQFPIERYLVGLTQASVPNRDGECPPGAGSYVGNPNCTNPLFATDLPDGTVSDPKTLCQLRRGTRDKSLIFYAHIGGVPYQLLHFTPDDSAKSTLSDADWQLILGKDPASFDRTGIDPHMIEDYKDRSGARVPQGGFAVKPPSDPGAGSDPVSGRDWITNPDPQAPGFQPSIDRQYACTFELTDPTTGAPAPRDCTQLANQEACDCPTEAGAPHYQIPSVCDPSNPTSQTHAKAYPTVREILLARLMGKQGILSSICPIHVSKHGEDDPLFGYRPAVAVIIDRLKNVLLNQCLPQPLTPDATGDVPCLILEVLPDSASKCDPNAGLSIPDPAIAARFRQQLQSQNRGDGGADDSSTHTICQLQELPVDANGSCQANSSAGWCYVTGAAPGCSQAILFSNSGQPARGVRVSLQCIERQDADAGSP